MALEDWLTIIVVTHDMQQAIRVSDRLALLLVAEDGVEELVGFGPTASLFGGLTGPRTPDYVNGRFG